MRGIPERIPFLFSSAMILVPVTAEARMILHYDLSSLIILSESVVLAEHVGERDPKASEHTFKVLKVYHGVMDAGERTIVRFRSYNLNVRNRFLFPRDREKEKKWDFTRREPRWLLSVLNDPDRNSGGRSR